MSDDKKYSEKLGLDMPFDEALNRFAEVTKEELEEEKTAEGQLALIPDGETDAVVFKGNHIRKVFHEGEWWFSVVDVVGALSDSSSPKRYWSDLKSKLLKEEGFSEVYDLIVPLPLPGSDGKRYKTDACNAEVLFRIIQSIPSPKAEPFKRWLAKVAYERIEEIQNPEVAIKRAIMSYQAMGRDMDWIEQRVRSIMVRKELTAEWKKRGIMDNEYAILTNILSTRTFGVGPREHKDLKRLKRHHNLRDHMTDLELILTQLAEKSTKEVAQMRDAQGFNQNKAAARVGGDIAGTARRSLEQETGKSVVSDSNFLEKGTTRRLLKDN